MLVVTKHTKTIFRLIVHANTNTSVEHESVKPAELTLQFLANLLDGSQIFQVALLPLHFAVVTILLELFNGFFCMLLFHREEIDLLGVVLKQMGDNTKTDSYKV